MGKSTDRLEVHRLDDCVLCYTIEGVALASILYSNDEVLL